MEIVVEDTEHGLRLDVLLVRRVAQLSRHKARELIRAGQVYVNGRRRAKGRSVWAGERVEVRTLPVEGEQHAAADTEVSLPIAYEDRWLVVVDKPAEMPCHPLRAGERGTVAGALIARYPEMRAVAANAREAGLVHRLDVGTSGLLIAARNRRTWEQMRAALGAHRIDKRYCALCQGRVRAPQHIASWLISDRSSKRRVKVSARQVTRSRHAVTEILSARMVAADDAGGPSTPSPPVAADGSPSAVSLPLALSLVEIRVWSGARHQIRAQLAWSGHPLAGDALYGGPAVKGLKRHFLHASELRFHHPEHGRRLRLHSALPDELRHVLQPG